jgi:hypothetical protein
MSRAAWIFWTVFAVTMAVYLTIVLWTLPHLQQMAGGLAAFDLRPMGYSPAEARAVVGALGAAGADYYLNVQHWLDTAYPGLMALVLVLAFRWLARGWLVWVLGAGAVIAALFDYLENHAVAVMLRAGPDGLSDVMVESASRWTVLKSASSTIVFVALLVLLLLAGWRWMGRR